MIAGFSAVVLFFGILGLAAAITILLALYSNKKPIPIYSLIGAILAIAAIAILKAKETERPVILPGEKME